MTKIVFSTTGAVIEGKKEHIEYDVIETPLFSGSTIDPFTHHDLNYDRETPSSAKNNAVIAVTNLPFGGEAYGISLDPAVATIDENLVIEWASNGLAELLIGNGDLGEKRYFREMVDTAVEPTLDTTSFQAGSLAAHIQSQMAGLISGLTEGDATQSFWQSNNYNVSAPAATRNPNLFTDTLDFSGVMIMSDREPDDRYAIALVSNRHGLVAAHVAKSPYLQVGDEVVFKRINGTYQNVIISDITAITVNGNDIDLAVVYFDQVITGCTFYKTMPNGFQETRIRGATELYPADGNGAAVYSGIPIIHKTMHDLNGNWESFLQITHLVHLNPSTDTVPPVGASIGYLSNNGSAVPQSVMANTIDWGINGIPGDSGSPSFLLINGEMILLCSQWNHGSAADIAFFTDEIEAIMTAQAGIPFFLQHPNLATFNSY